VCPLTTVGRLSPVPPEARANSRRLACCGQSENRRPAVAGTVVPINKEAEDCEFYLIGLEHMVLTSIYRIAFR
jgi:hypothetical protein